MKHGNTNLVRGFFFVLFLLIALIYLPASDFLNQSLNSSTIITIDQDVSFQWNEGEKQILDLSEYSFEAPHRGDIITIEKTLPDEKIIHPVLVLELYHCAVDVYLEGEHVYTYGQDLYEQINTLKGERNG